MDPDVIDRLFAAPLEDFVEERKRLAREIRAAGDRDTAAEVAKLPKPTPPAWALNFLAREDPDAVGAWLAAADALRDASARPGAGLREAMAAHRDATRALLATVRDRARPGGRALSEPMLERVRALLQAATVDEEQADALRAGRIVEGEEPLTLFGGPAEPGAAPPPREEKPRPRRAEAAERREAERAAREREAERKERERAERIAQLERHVAEAEEKLARLQGEAEERDAAAESADARLEEARRTLNRTESEAEAAHDAADEAHTAVAAAERELRQLTRQLRNVSGAG